MDPLSFYLLTGALPPWNDLLFYAIIKHQNAKELAMESTPRNALLCLILCLLFLQIASPSIAASPLDRDSDPVIITGIDLSNFIGIQPDAIVGFRYESGWIQVPVQVDERTIIDFGAVYNEPPIGITTWTYSDTSTFVGADSDPAFDMDDELVFMAKDTGTRISPIPSEPNGVIADSGYEVDVYDPIGGQHAYLYLFVSDGSLAPDADTSYVTYSFNLISGNYKATYSLMTGPNPENSEVITDFYRLHFSDRWIRDEVNVYAGTATGVDILDRHKNLFGPGNCGRSEDTFSAGEGAFFINKDGPVRGIRSYMGANSGPLTQREHFFYEKRQDLSTYLRVHAISGVMDFYDYSPASSLMTYYNDLNTSGVPIDGSPDIVSTGSLIWEMITGAQGTLAITLSIVTDISGFAYTSYYSDDSTPSVTQCTGDDYEYGSSGPWIDQAIPNTDPNITPNNNFISSRSVYYEEPNQTIGLAEERYAHATYPLITSITTGVAGDSPAPSPMQLHVHPNPFSGETQIQFALDEADHVSIRVYDAAGRLITTVYSGWADGGLNQIAWNRRDAKGLRVSSGIYFCRLMSGNNSVTRKLIAID
jgi:hypothetical protein